MQDDDETQESKEAEDSTKKAYILHKVSDVSAIKLFQILPMSNSLKS